MKKLGKSTKKGFTLVELIVVLVILAVLAAMLVPALVGYIDRAKKEKEYQTASTVYAAAQAVITEKYATDDLTDKDIIKDEFTVGNPAVDEVIDLAGVDPNAVKDYKFAFGDNHVIGSSGVTAVSAPSGYTAPAAATGETIVGYVEIGNACYFLYMKDGTPRWDAALKSST